MGTSTPSCASSFVFDLEISGPVLKRSGIEIKLSNTESTESVLTIDTFAGGLSEYVGPDPEADPAESESESPNAGMQLTIAGNQLRPFVFFQSSGDLMSLYWSGALEQRNPAIQGNMMILDDTRIVTLASGFPVQLSASGTLSFDSSGQAAVSMWTQTADTKIENGGAFVFETHCSLRVNEGDLIKSAESLETKVSLDSRTNINVGNGQMCIRVTQPKAELIIRRTLEVGSKQIDSSERTETVQAKSILLDNRISDMCKAMRGI